MHFMYWTCPLTGNHLKCKTTKTFWKREPLTENYQRQKNASNTPCFFAVHNIRTQQHLKDTSPTMIFLKPQEPHTSKKRQSRTKLPSFGIQFRVLRWRTQWNINITEKCSPAQATTLAEFLEFLSFILVR